MSQCRGTSSTPARLIPAVLILAQLAGAAWIPESPAGVSYNPQRIRRGGLRGESRERVWPRQNPTGSSSAGPSSSQSIIPSSSISASPSNFAAAAPIAPTATESVSSTGTVTPSSAILSETTSTSVPLPTTTRTTSTTSTSTTPTTSTRSTSISSSVPSVPSSRTTRSSSSSTDSSTPSPISADSASVPVTTLVVNGQGLLSTVRILPTSSSPPNASNPFAPSATANASSATSSDSFWDNKGAVAGIFTAGGLAVLALMVLVGNYIRRYYARKAEDDILRGFQDGGSESPRYLDDSPTPSMAEITAPAPAGSYPDRNVFNDPIPQPQYPSLAITPDYPPGTQYQPYAPTPEISYGMAISDDEEYRAVQSASAQGSPALTSASSYSSYSSANPFASPVIVPPPSLLLPHSDSYQRPISYDSFYANSPRV
ncbi:hypothetical protein EYR40_005169 [Pleurotus pulmonarius]|nr:hypothetical protein EYR40_005169 [Pleurotus pulmonarius]